MTYKPQSKTKAFTEVLWAPKTRTWQAVRSGLPILGKDNTLVLRIGLKILVYGVQCVLGAGTA